MSKRSSVPLHLYISIYRTHVILHLVSLAGRPQIIFIFRSKPNCIRNRSINPQTKAYLRGKVQIKLKVID
ncbi:hypothetical protein BDV29DRAFT_173017 [Aspergillus leporis]|uniref:Uncharacterized protein n=1 Tax=Aspergillus leporis TaxID=41062 RepID=A0A5N5X5Y6_9EURO|nr:hypothetical protein BDV29DRAFT_173017 [Aspergillus leporis]